MTRKHLVNALKECGAVNDQRGAAAVEFGLILPIVILILFGIIEFGRAWNVKQVLTDAAREGARVAVVRQGGVAKISQDSLESLVRNTVKRAAGRAGIDTTTTKFTLTANASTGVGGDAGTPATVTIAYQYSPLFGTWVINQNLLTLQTQFVMRNE